jgi:hypothetical protein
MRFVIAGLILMTALPAAEGKTGDTGVCKSRCDTNYQFCRNRSASKNARKSCAADRKTCKRTCPSR